MREYERRSVDGLARGRGKPKGESARGAERVIENARSGQHHLPPHVWM